MRVVVALGGNALLRPGEALTVENQQRNLVLAAKPLARIAAHHELVITHGNGPQIGLLAASDNPLPLDVLDAETEGMLGYLIELEMRNALPSDRTLATLLTQVEIEGSDPALKHPTKPIGRHYEKHQADQLAASKGWSFKETKRGHRRVVPSPEPRAILACNAIRTLLGAGNIVICGGGGGIPVTRGADKRLHGVEAVVDKDLVSALLASSLRADALLLLTDVDAVYARWDTPDAAVIEQYSHEEVMPEAFEAGSMRPKLEAAKRFVSDTSGGRKPFAGIGALQDAERILHGSAGTRVD